MEYKQRDWLKLLVSVKFAMNNKIHSATKLLLFIENYGKELRMRTDIKRKEKVEK